jgi:vacuolar-type H+-ATPase subunit F/Vma7
MSTPVFIGDEVSAAGFRLAGLRVRVPSDDDLLATIKWACDQAPLVLIGAETAERLPAAELDEALSRLSPPVVIVPDVRGRGAVPDVANRLRRQLGMLE